MAWVLTTWSSSSCWISSTEARILVPDVRYSFVSNTSPLHSFSMMSMLFSSEYSLEAATQVYHRNHETMRTGEATSEREKKNISRCQDRTLSNPPFPPSRACVPVIYVEGVLGQLPLDSSMSMLVVVPFCRGSIGLHVCDCCDSKRQGARRPKGVPTQPRARREAKRRSPAREKKQKTKTKRLEHRTWFSQEGKTTPFRPAPPSPPLQRLWMQRPTSPRAKKRLYFRPASIPCMPACVQHRWRALASWRCST